MKGEIFNLKIEAMQKDEESEIQRKIKEKKSIDLQGPMSVQWEFQENKTERGNAEGWWWLTQVRLEYLSRAQERPVSSDSKTLIIPDEISLKNTQPGHILVDFQDINNKEITPKASFLLSTSIQ